MMDDEELGFLRGDPVRLRMHPSVTGQVVDERGWGSEYLVRIGLNQMWFADVELQLVHPEPSEPQEQENYTNNVVNLATVRAKGAA